ncbi:hypothetical protein BgAZ_404750 [Babesia gibsoni]|uniref:RRM domain-containing protein n=1 Tax=Babesia gibsoni TaxID=33632 RepID=A0AAD8LGX7_BABGI|nr:hypothetical protein BgAZ_404750 [Babesia gibsoni]
MRFEEQRIAAFRIFVSKLAYEATREDLENYFKQFGNVTDTHIPKQHGNLSLNKGYGFVSFDNESDVIRVLQTPSHVILGREVMLDRATGQKYHSSAVKSQAETQTYYGSQVSGGISDRYADLYQKYRRHYESNIPLVDRYYRRERDDHYRYSSYDDDRNGISPMGYSRPYPAFDPHKPVSYVFSGSVRSDHYGDMGYGRHLPSRSSPSPKPRIRPVPKLFIGRLNPETSVNEVRSYFSQFGEIVDAYIPRDPYTHKSKGYAFLTFAHKDALHAVMQPNAKHYLGGREIVVDYADMEAVRRR